MRILYVEDNPANLFLVQRVARMGNHDVITYSEGQPALDHFKEDKPDLVLMDIQLSGLLNGLDVVKALRAAGYKTPIVAVTAYAMSGDREKCIEAGCDGYLAKPLPVGELVELFKRYEPTPVAKPAEAPVPAAPAPVAVAPAPRLESVPEVKPAPVAPQSAPAAPPIPTVSAPVAPVKADTAPVAPPVPTVSAPPAADTKVAVPAQPAVTPVPPVVPAETAMPKVSVPAATPPVDTAPAKEPTEKPAAPVPEPKVESAAPAPEAVKPADSPNGVDPSPSQGTGKESGEKLSVDSKQP
jgi:CheY-like chemotaxis protein